MRANGPRHPRRHPGRRLAAVVFVLLLALSSAAGTINRVPVGGDVALGGPLAVHPTTSQPPPAYGLPDDALPPAGAPQPVALSVPAGPQLAVPILYYHYIRTIVPTAQNLLSFDLSISPQLFAEQMALLHVEGAHPITLATLMDALSGKRALPAHPVVLTFDDGYADFATAVEPVMARYGFVATDFVASGFVNKPRYMTAAQVLQMEADGMVIGSHTVHHADLAVLPPAAALAEIQDGKATLEGLLRHPVLDFAYPYGAFNAVVAQLVQQAGFREAVTTVHGDVQTLNGRFELHRTEMGGAPSIATFAADAGVPLPSSSQYAVIVILAHQPAVARTA
jgi:peptidoglycan/xylan/chitin deacetylase (PgdA/CDA1 family)